MLLLSFSLHGLGCEAGSEGESGTAGHALRGGGQAHCPAVFPDLRALPLSGSMKASIMKSARSLGRFGRAEGRASCPVPHMVACLA